MSSTSVSARPGRPKKATERKGQAVLAERQTTALAEFGRLRQPGVYAELHTTPNGLRSDQLDVLRRKHGANEVRHDRPAPAIVQFLATFKNPFILILLFLGVIMYAIDVQWADPEEGPDYQGVITVSVMVLVSVTLRFWQEYRSGRAAEALKAMVSTTAATTRHMGETVVTAEIPIEQLLPGDIVQLAAGDMIPADVRVVRAKDLQVNQSMLSGESMPAEKTGDAVAGLDPARILEAENLGFMGTSVVSGSGTAVVVHTGDDTYFGAMTAGLATTRPETSFDIGVKKVSFLLIRFMAVMVPAVFIINGLTKDWSQALLFGVATAVGLTPEMLPLIVTANLAKGALHMSRHKVIIKQLNAIQNFGAMDVLCTDKTGTLTEDRIVLEEHLDTAGRPSTHALRLAAMNSVFQTGLRNLLDGAVVEAAGPELIARIRREHGLVDEIPFDFARRRMSVVVDDGDTDLIITKGAVEEVLSACTSVELDGVSHDLAPGLVAAIDRLVAQQNGQGKRVLALATRRVPADAPDGTRREYSTADETEMTLVGFLTFLDPPKASAGAAIEALHAHGTAVKVITGDNELVAETVSGKVGLDVGTVVTGAEIDRLDDGGLDAIVKETTVFAKVNPLQKARIVESLKRSGHTVGFLGDGVNDAPALRVADVGISVDTAADIARESADIILLEKDLGVLERGVVEGRRTFGNILKYIKMTASSNFGNMFSVLVASALLPFLPMIPAVLLVQNLVYDLSMLTIPWDRVDKEFLDKPRKWETRSLTRFMIFIGPISSIFDLTTFALMWFVFSANTPDQASLFQSGWFIESLISQTLIVHMIRTQRIPFLQSRASLPVMVTTGLACVFGLVFPFTGWGHSLGLVSLPGTYFPWLVVTLVAYCGLAQLAKVWFIRRFGGWL
ncbi:magnesium-translocating P-type ATPase [Rhodococcus sp. NPDC127528]|uniref:magnesium-translocating P-type ATPase n=1 Tax=unclassified Rhodococcus (in: high G+C Gram-positive bacteria) TaxID=192944 RepID=UPI00363E3FF6